MTTLFGSLLLLLIVIIVMAALLFAIASMRRRRHGTSGSLAGAALEMQALLEPERKHALRVVQEDREAESDESGDSNS
jgi:hypothetical protein